eukprot:gene2856-4699_t
MKSIDNEDFTDPYEAGIYYMKKKNIKGKLLFCMLAGSIAFNTNFEHSDYDFFGVYVSNLNNYLEIEDEKIIDISTSLSDEKPDFVLYEVGKFCEGIILGQPLIILSFYSNLNLCYETKEWKELKRHRESFIYQQTIKGFISYIKNQIKIIKERKNKKYSKPLYHSFRLLFEIESMIKNKEPIMYFENEKKEYLMNIRLQQKKKNEYLNELKIKLNDILLKMNELDSNFKSIDILNECSYFNQHYNHLHYQI